MTVYYTMVRGGTVDVWLTGADVTFCSGERSGTMQVESDLPLAFTPVAPGGYERIAWDATPETEDPADAEVVIELPKGTKVIITDLASYNIEGSAADINIVDMRT